MAVVPKKFDPETAGNFEDMEKQFAVKTVQQIIDDEILEHLHKEFPGFDPAEILDEDKMKSKEGKEKWRNFVTQYEKGEKKIEDYNFGTMLRKGSKMEYGEKETILVLRMQFFAVEIARNRAGLNDWIYEAAQKEKK